MKLGDRPLLGDLFGPVGMTRGQGHHRTVLTGLDSGNNLFAGDFGGTEDAPSDLSHGWLICQDGVKKRIGERGFEPPTSASRTQHSSQTELLPEREAKTIADPPSHCKRQKSTTHAPDRYQ